MSRLNSSNKLRRIVLIAVFGALAYALMLVIHFKVSFLTLDLKDEDISFDLNGGTLTGIVGANGSGKTTLLKAICGILPHKGTCVLDGTVLEDLSARNIAKLCSYIPQRSGITIDISALDVVLMGFNPRLGLLEQPTQAMVERAHTALAQVGLGGREQTNYLHLSEGQKQLCILARTLVSGSRLLLLDEPLGALDLQLRRQMQVELKRLQKKLGITFIYVTHDQEEALSMSDVVVVMSGGHIQQIGSPVDIYNEPVNAFVADFIGESNIVDGFMPADHKVRFAGHTFECLDGGFEKNEPVDVVVRPEDVVLKDAGEGQVDGKIISSIFKGVHYEIIVDIRHMLKNFRLTAYNEDTGKGFLRHVLVKHGFSTGEIMVVLVTATPQFPSKRSFINALVGRHPEITTIVQNVNNKFTSMILGDREEVLFGNGYIEDVLCGNRFRISPKSFFAISFIF